MPTVITPQYPCLKTKQDDGGGGSIRDGNYAPKWVNSGRTSTLTLLEGEPVVLAEVIKLLEQKRNAPELGLAPAVPALNAFIEAELGEEQFDVPKKSRSPEIVGLLNTLFHNALREYGANYAIKVTGEDTLFENPTFK